MGEPQKDLVVEARELALYVQGVADSNGGGKLSRVPELLRQLADEVERLREHVKAQNIELESLRYSRMFSDTHVGED